MKVKTSELIGPALDWAVAKCEVAQGVYIKVRTSVKDVIDNTYMPMVQTEVGYGPENWTVAAFSTDWSQGGPIIEKEDISVQCFDRSSPLKKKWNAYMPGEMPYRADEEINGPTALIAAMRAFVINKLGTEVEVPDELV